jgi:hypothetical protein
VCVASWVLYEALAEDSGGGDDDDDDNRILATLLASEHWNVYATTLSASFGEGEAVERLTSRTAE